MTSVLIYAFLVLASTSAAYQERLHMRRGFRVFISVVALMAMIGCSSGMRFEKTDHPRFALDTKTGKLCRTYGDSLEVLHKKYAVDVQAREKAKALAITNTVKPKTRKKYPTYMEAMGATIEEERDLANLYRLSGLGELPPEPTPITGRENTPLCSDLLNEKR
jgi:hypothetical protein